MREKDALHFAEGRHRDAIQDVVAIAQQYFGHADERSVEFVPSQHFRELGRGDENDLLLQSAGQGNGVEVGHGPDAEGGKRLAQVVFALELHRPVFALEAVGQFLRRIRRGHAEFGGVVGQTHVKVPANDSSTY